MYLVLGGRGMLICNLICRYCRLVFMFIDFGFALDLIRLCVC